MAGVKLNSISGIGIILFFYFLFEASQRNGDTKYVPLICSAITVVSGFLYQYISDTYQETSFREKIEITARIQDKLNPYFDSIRKKLKILIGEDDNEDDGYRRGPRGGPGGQRDHRNPRDSRINRQVSGNERQQNVNRDNAVIQREGGNNLAVVLEHSQDKDGESSGNSVDPTAHGTEKKKGPRRIRGG